jgi:hypothetical protein
VRNDGPDDAIRGHVRFILIFCPNWLGTEILSHHNHAADAEPSSPHGKTKDNDYVDWSAAVR